MGWLTSAAKVAAILAIVAIVVASATAFISRPGAMVTSAWTDFKTARRYDAEGVAPNDYEQATEAFGGVLTVWGGLDGIRTQLLADEAGLILVAIGGVAVAVLAFAVMQRSQS